MKEFQTIDIIVYWVYIYIKKNISITIDNANEQTLYSLNAKFHKFRIMVD